jgi:hypothetical protein
LTTEPPPIRVAGPAAPPARCTDCGARLPVDARFCPACGAARGWSVAKPTDVRLHTTVGAGFRFGIGFFLAAAAFAIVWGLISLVVFGAFVGALASGISGLGSTGSQRFEGTGNEKSSPFALTGSVDVEWKAAPVGSASCRHRSVLSRADRPIASEVIVDQAITSEQTGIYTAVGLPAADYVLDVESDCTWSFRFSPKRP